MKRFLLPALLLSCTTPHPDIRAEVQPFRYGSTVELGDIDEDSVAPVLAALSAVHGPQATLRIDSPGGSVFTGLKFIRKVTDLKKSSGLKVTCIVDGAAYSMAAVILESPVCDVRLATPQATVLFHNGHSANIEGGAEEIASAARLLEALNGALAALVSGRLGLTPAEYRAKIAGRDWAMDSLGALAAHAVDGIVPQSEIAPATQP